MDKRQHLDYFGLSRLQICYSVTISLLNTKLDWMMVVVVIQPAEQMARVSLGHLS